MPSIRSAGARAALLLLAAAPLRGQSAAPEPSAAWKERLAREVAAVIDAGDSTAVDAFVRDRVSPRRLERGAAARLTGTLLGIARQGGGVEVRALEPWGGGVLAELWARRTDRGVRLYVSPDRGDSTRISGLETLGFIHPEAAVRLEPREGDDLAAVLRRLDAEVDRLAAADEFSGTVLVARGDSVVYERAAGVADRRTGEPVRPGTRFHSASMGKMFTAVAVGQLVEAGRLRWDDSLAAVLPDLPWHPGLRGVTVAQLLGHFSGVGGWWSGAPGDDSLPPARSRLEEVARYASRPPLSPPGSRWSYSNEGFEVLAAIVERRGGAPFHRYLAERVFAPAGMRGVSAGVPATDAAVGYGLAGDDPFGMGPRAGFEARVAGRAAGGSGGQFATARDYFRFARALHDGALLRGATLDSLLVAGFDQGVMPWGPQQYARGFTTALEGGRLLLGHAGGGMHWGICGRMDTLRDGGWTVVVLSNYDPPVCEVLARRVLASLARLPGG
ncbi:MAG TPA: serine hydrolase domain-containing protein [Longimicrobiaceae bacterium]|nr:serine hydrolase domain-containing protein [Longimicrobiaceae bacterium]